jgi:opacity protein-like surface antigen
MKSKSYVAIAAALSVSMFALTPAMAEGFPSVGPYVEGQIGRMQVNDVDGSTSAAAGGFNVDASTKAEYDSDIAFGAEIGVRKIADTGFRVGASFTSFQADLEQVDLGAALSFNGTVIGTAAGTFTADQLATAGVTLDNDVKAYSINAYYDFDLDKRFTPYVGVGIGLADIENANDKELMLSGHAGINYALTEKLYVGARGTYHRINGPSDSFGIDYDDITAYSVGAVVGYNF